MGEEARRIGEDGERLFLNLARQWGEVEYTPKAVGTDGYLRWPNVHANRLFVQVKTAKKQPRLSRKSNAFRIRIEEKDIREWYAYRPLLILCVLEKERAWWKDTAEEPWALNPRKYATVEIPLHQPVDATTRDAVQKCALQRARHVPAGVLPMSVSRQVLRRDEIVPETLRKLSSQETLSILRDIYAEMADTSVVERDGMALAAARLIHCNLHSLGTNSADAFLEIVLPRMSSRQQGGRSNTLGALASLLRPSLNYRLDRAFLDDLESAIDLAVTAKTFVNPEFGLLIGASLVARFPRHTHLSDHVRHLTLKALNDPQTETIKRISKLLKANFEQCQGPVDRLVSPKWLARRILRPLRQDDEIFRKLDEAIEAAWRIVKCTPAEAQACDLSLFNQLTRFQAIDLLHKLRR